MKILVTAQLSAPRQGAREHFDESGRVSMVPTALMHKLLAPC